MKLLVKYLLCLLVLNAIFLLYLLKYEKVSYPLQVGPQFDGRIRHNYLDTLNDHYQDMVLIGDSMLHYGVNFDKLSVALNEDILNIDLPGSGSTLWYLIIKNNIAEADTPPGYLVIFYRDSELTVPGLRVKGKYLEQIDEYASNNEDLLIQYAYLNQMNPVELAAEKYLPPFNYRWKIRAHLDSYIRYGLPGVVLECSTDCTDLAMVRVFGDDNLEPGILSNAIDAADNYLYTPKALDFDNQIDISFLPEIIRMCKEKNIQLIAVHMKTLHVARNPSVAKSVDEYNKKLDEYFQDNGVIHLDFSHDARLTENLFKDSLHFNDEGRQVFTKMLAEELSPYVR